MTRFLAVLGVLFISFTAIWVRLADVSPTTAAFFRCLYAIPLLFLLWCRARSGDRRLRLSRWLALGSGILLALDLIFFHHAIALIGAGLATVLGNTQVIFVGLAAWLLHRERPSRFAILIIPVVFAGVVFISGLGRADAYGANPVTGAIFGVFTGISYASFLLVFRASNRELAPAAGPLLDSTLCGTLVCLLIGVFEPAFSLTPTWPAHGWILALALGSQVIGWLFIAIALPRLAALETSVLLLLQPALTVLWARFIFTEHLSNLQWIGVLLVLGGITVVSMKGSVVGTAKR